jgi:uncharacterized protein YegL
MIVSSSEEQNNPQTKGKIMAKTKTQQLSKTATLLQDTFISIVADASGSMDHLHATVIKGLNDFIAEQAKSPAVSKVSIVQFPASDGDPGIRSILKQTDVKKARPITPEDYIINGMTPLYDAIGLVIDKADTRIAKRVAAGKTPESQVIVIFTDGGENASRRYSQKDIFKLIDKRKAQGWVFVFLGANQDSFETGGGLSFEEGNTMNFEASEEGMAYALSTTSHSLRLLSVLPPTERLAVRNSIFTLGNDDLDGR